MKIIWQQQRLRLELVAAKSHINNNFTQQTINQL